MAPMSNMVNKECYCIVINFCACVINFILSNGYEDRSIGTSYYLIETKGQFI